MSVSPESSTDPEFEPLPPRAPSFARPLPALRCSSRSSLGNRCGNYATPGAEVCRSHGAQLPSVKAKAAARVEAARLRLFGSAEDAVATLEALLEPGTADAVRLKAATEVLDRVGIKTATEIDVQVTSTTSPAQEIADRLGRLANREIAPVPAPGSSADEDDIPIDDAEVVDTSEVDTDDD